MSGFAPSSRQPSCTITPGHFFPPRKLRKQSPTEAVSLTQGCTAKKHIRAQSLCRSCVHFFPGREQAGTGRRGGSGDSLSPVTSAAFRRLSSCWIHATQLPYFELSGGWSRLADQSLGCGERVCRRAEEFASEPRRSAVWMAAQHTARQLFS